MPIREKSDLEFVSKFEGIGYTFKIRGGHKAWKHGSYYVIRYYNINKPFIIISLVFPDFSSPESDHFLPLPSTRMISLLEYYNSLTSLPAFVLSASTTHNQSHNNQSNPFEAMVLQMGSLD